MVQETWWQWTKRVNMEMLGTPWMAFAPINMLLLGVYNWVFPFKKDVDKTLPTSVANRSFYMFTMSVPDMAGFLLLLIYSVLDVVETPGGLKLDDASINLWKDEVKDDERWWVSERDWYGWNWWNRKIFQSDNLIANVDGLYKTKDLILDIWVTGAAFLLMLVAIQNRAVIIGKVSGIFKNQMTRRRNKRMKNLAETGLEQGEDILARLEKLLVGLDTRHSESALRILEDEVEPGIDDLLSRKGKIRL